MIVLRKVAVVAMSVFGAALGPVRQAQVILFVLVLCLLGEIAGHPYMYDEKAAAKKAARDIAKEIAKKKVVKTRQEIDDEIAKEVENMKKKGKILGCLELGALVVEWGTMGQG